MASRWVFSPEKLRARRQERKLSRARLARAIDVGEGATQSWKDGTAPPRLASYLHIVEASDCEVDDLLADLVDRGLDTAQGVLCVRDGIWTRDPESQGHQSFRQSFRVDPHGPVSSRRARARERRTER